MRVQVLFTRAICTALACVMAIALLIAMNGKSMAYYEVRRVVDADRIGNTGGGPMPRTPQKICNPDTPTCRAN